MKPTWARRSCTSGVTAIKDKSSTTLGDSVNDKSNKASRYGIYCALTVCAAVSQRILFAQQSNMVISVESHGDYSVGSSQAAALVSGVAAQVDGQWLHSGDYPHHEVNKTAADGYFGTAEQWQVTFTGLSDKPDLVYRLRTYRDEPFADLQVTVRNRTGNEITVQAVRSVEASGDNIHGPGGPQPSDRVLSDSFSEDRPAMRLHELSDAPTKMHKAVGSQLIYNRESGQSLLIAALTSERFLTILRLSVEGTGKTARIARYEVDSTGTTEMEKENSLEKAPATDQIELSLPVPSGGEVSSEALVFSLNSDYHHQLETYGALISRIHNARVSAPSLMGWWSWTAYYFGLNEGAALTNAAWEAEYLKPFGYDIFHIDEGYQYARGEYGTPDTRVFPNGLGPMEYKIRGLGLIPGIWTAPFEVSERSWVYQQHPEWLVKNAQGKPIHAGYVDDEKDKLYMLDTTNPDARQYLSTTYRKLVKEWGVHYIKLDFMDDSAIEGFYYKPHTTALEAQRIGLQIIRDNVGDDVYLDKDGSAMLNPVGYVDFGRVSQDTGHSFDASREAVDGIAARYYMNRNFFVSDPDAFTVSTQRINDQSWHEGRAPLTLDEAKVSIALAAVTGGMLEIGDNLISLQNAPDRVALLQNRDLINMVRLGNASVPVDLMTYPAEDIHPSVFLLKESKRQRILTVFNWTEKPRSKVVALADLGLGGGGQYVITDIFDGNQVEASAGSLSLQQAPRSVHVLKIVDRNVAEEGPVVSLECPKSGTSGEVLSFSAHAAGDHPAVSYKWDFGDGVHLDGAHPGHAWTSPGEFKVHVTATGLDEIKSEKTCSVRVSSHLPTVFNPSKNKRYQEK